MVQVGRRAGIAELPLGIRLHGTPGWVAWLLVHLVKLAGFRNRISVLESWAWNYLTGDRAYRPVLGLPEGDTGRR